MLIGMHSNVDLPGAAALLNLYSLWSGQSLIAKWGNHKRGIPGNKAVQNPLFTIVFGKLL